jgi:hypothetical protein
MLGVAMLASFLVGYLNRAAWRYRVAYDRRVVAELLPPRPRCPPLPPATLADRDWEVPVARQVSARLDWSYSDSGRGWLEADRVRPSVDWDIAAPPYGGAVLPEGDGDKRTRSNLTISCPE